MQYFSCCKVILRFASSLHVATKCAKNYRDFLLSMCGVRLGIGKVETNWFDLARPSRTILFHCQKWWARSMSRIPKADCK